MNTPPRTMVRISVPDGCWYASPTCGPSHPARLAAGPSAQHTLVPPAGSSPSVAAMTVGNGRREETGRWILGSSGAWPSSARPARGSAVLVPPSWPARAAPWRSTAATARARTHGRGDPAGDGRHRHPGRRRPRHARRAGAPGRGRAQVDILVNNNGGPPPERLPRGRRGRPDRGREREHGDPDPARAVVVDGMVERRFGRIVNITSGSVKMPLPGLDLSSGARAGLTGFLAGVARSVAHANVTINFLLPGSFDTPRMRRSRRVRPGSSASPPTIAEHVRRSPRGASAHPPSSARPAPSCARRPPGSSPGRAFCSMAAPTPAFCRSWSDVRVCNAPRHRMSRPGCWYRRRRQ